MRGIILGFLLLGSFCSAYSQKSIEESYRSYTIIRTTNTNKKAAIDVAIDLLKRAPELTNSQIANLNFNLGRLYEETMEVEKAIPYYEASLKLAPDYYVTHRALGSIYVKGTNSLVKKMNDAGNAKQMDLYGKLFAEYKQVIVKALPHLEKAQACDPDEQSYKQITNLYKNIKDLAAIGTLDVRLKKQAITCVDLLDD
ncbi:MAG: hypothetical protein V4663_01885 [Bacteroidota bacterium]